MTDRYPPPSYAVTIWLSGDRIMVAIPEASAVEIPLDRLEPQTSDFGSVLPGNRGLAVLLDLLRNRAANRAPTIGMNAAPLRHSVEQALASDIKYIAWQAAMAATAESKAEAKEFLKELGLEA